MTIPSTRPPQAAWQRGACRALLGAWLLAGAARALPAQADEALPSELPAPVAVKDVVPAPPPPPPPPPASGERWLLRRGAFTARLSLFAGTQVVAENAAFWGLASVFAPGAGYDPDRVWDEAWALPSVRFTFDACRNLQLYGGLGVAATGTLGRDLFDQGDSGRISLEGGFAGVRLTDPRRGLGLDVSAGPQPYRVGSGFLVDLGAQNGNERGAALVAPRRAWENSVLVRASAGRLGVDAFLLDYNEIGDDDPDTTLAGAKVELALAPKPQDAYVGATYLYALDSSMPYVQAPVALIEDGREDTQTAALYARLRPLGCRAPSLYAALDVAYQWNDRIDLRAHAFNVEVGYQWERRPWRPRLSLALREYGGDDPDTARLERFDPLFYDGGVHAFASGSNAALAIYNTNVRTFRAALHLTLTPRDMLSLTGWRVEAVETGSPLQFGQAGRIEVIGGQPVLVSGIPTRHVSDDLYVEYLRVLSPCAFLTLGVGASFPASGLESAAGRSLDAWVGGLVNLSFQL